MSTLRFWGGVGTVTGSKYMIEDAGRRVLVDCGLFQGLKQLRLRNWQAPPFNPRSLNTIVLTHAHIDHTGYLPRLVAEGYDGPVYCTRGTADLLNLLLPDAARIQEEDAEYANRKGYSKHRPALPLYTERDARAALKLVRRVDYHQPVEICAGFTARFRIAGHLLGSSLVLIECGAGGARRRILFSGDLGRYDRPILRDPEAPLACDYLLIESTYGDREHAPTDPKQELARIINQAAAEQSPVLIPAFAVGRTQELLYLIRELEDERAIPALPVTVDSPMANAATRIYEARPGEHDEEYASVLAAQRHPLRPRSFGTAATREESRALNEARGARVIIAASGMMTGGRVLHHARRMLPDPKAVIVFVGFQAAGTRGRRVVDGEREIKLLGEMVPVRARIEQISGFSAHADWREVLRWLEAMPAAPRRTFVTHGEPEAAAAMARRIRERFGWEVVIPEYGDEVEW
jgi:metallo-beta-lactamase family protein